MLVLTLIGAFVLSLLCALIMIPSVRRLALARGWMDRPDGHRKVHVSAIPRVGGLAIILAMVVTLGVVMALRAWLPEEFSIAIALPSAPIIFGALLMAGVGFVDDVRDMHALPKLLAQSAVSLLVVAGGMRITLFDSALGGGEVALFVSSILTLIWVVGTVNGVNFIDGVDGLAGGVVAIALVGLGIAHVIGGDVSGTLVVVVAIGAVLGFLRYNVQPASIFMGDVGSHFLGYVLAIYALKGTAHSDPFVALSLAAVALGLPVLDACITLVRRPQYDKPLLHSDGDHFHHRLLMRFPSSSVVLILYLVSIFFAGCAILMASLSTGGALVALVICVASTIGFLLWLGYVPGRFAKGPADGYGSSRSLHRFVLDGSLAPGGDGTSQTADVSIVSRTSSHASGVVKNGPET